MRSFSTCSRKMLSRRPSKYLLSFFSAAAASPSGKPFFNSSLISPSGFWRSYQTSDASSCPAHLSGDSQSSTSAHSHKLRRSPGGVTSRFFLPALETSFFDTRADLLDLLVRKLDRAVTTTCFGDLFRSDSTITMPSLVPTTIMFSLLASRSV